jgi:hypothetical protein
MFNFNMLNVVGNVITGLKHESDDTWQESSLKIGGGTVLIGACAYGGTYFFTRYHPMIGAGYVSLVALISQIAYCVLEVMKENIDDPLNQHVVTVVQLLQIPFFCYLFNRINGEVLSAATKMEIISATAHFAAIPVVIHLGKIAWDDPTVEHIGAAMGVMLPLASRLQTYAEMFK